MAHPKSAVTALSLAAGCAMSFAVVAARAQARTDAFSFDNEDGDFLWNNGTNWDPDGVPGTGDEAGADVGINAMGIVTVNSLSLDLGQFNCSTGLFKNGGDLITRDLSSIVNFTHTSCCTDVIRAFAKLSIEDALIATTVRFEGAGPIEFSGDVELQDAPIIDGSTEVKLLETTRLTDGMQMEDNSRLTLLGQTTMPRSAGIRVRGPAIGQLVSLEGGEIGFFDTVSTSNRQTFITVDFVTQAGTIFADDGFLRVNAPFYRIRNATVEPRNEGTVWFQGASLSAEYENVTFQGTGAVEINASATFKGSSTSTVDGVAGGLTLDASTLTMDGTLTCNSGFVRVRTGTLAGNGSLTIAGGSALFDRLTSIEAFLNVTGGTVSIDSSVRVPGDIVINGGTLIMEDAGGITSEQLGAVSIVSGTLETAIDLPFNTTRTIDSIVEMTGGSIVSRSGNLNIIADGSQFMSGTVQVAPVADDEATMRMFARTGATFDVGSLMFNGNGQFDFGTNGSGNKGEINVTGAITNNIGQPVGGARGMEIKTRLFGDGSITNTGVFILGPSAVLDVDVTNNGAADLDGFNAIIGKTFTNNSSVSHTAQTRLGNDARIINNNEWFVVRSANLLEDGVNAATVVNNGDWELLGQFGPVVNQTISAQFTNNGTVVVNNGTLTLFDSTNLTLVGVLTGGTWETGANGRINFPFTSLTVLEGQGTTIKGDENSITGLSDLEQVRGGAMLVVPETEDVNIDNDLKLDEGIIRILGEGLLNIADDLEAEKGSTVELVAPSSVETGGNINIGGENQPPSIIDTIDFKFEPARPAPRVSTSKPTTVTAQNLNLRGRLIAGSSVQINAQVNAFPSAEWMFDVASPSTHDSLSVAGDVSLDGELRVTTATGFTITGGDRIVLLSSTGTITGDFSAITVLGTGKDSIEVEITPTEIALVLGCPADLNDSGAVDISDLLILLSDFEAGAGGDIDGDGMTDITDLLRLLAVFNTACPESDD